MPLISALSLGIIDIFAGIIVFGMFFYFLSIKGNGLRSILCHLFLSWASRYSVLGTIAILSFFFGHEIVSYESLRVITTFFVFIEFTALVRFYFYITKNKIG